MKTLTKTFYIDGETHCSIDLIQNESTRTVKGTHAVTHDDYTTQIPVHACKGFVSGKQVANENFEKWDSSTIEATVTKVEDKINSFINNDKAVRETQKEIGKTLSKLGF